MSGSEGIVFKFLKRRTAKNSHSPSPPRTLIFNSSESAFRHMCKYGLDEWKQGSSHVALVLDSTKMFGTKEAVRRNEDGTQIATLRIATNDGGIVLPALTAGSKTPPLLPGDFVLWIASTHMPEIAREAADPRYGWVGLIVGVLGLELDTRSGNFAMTVDYRDYIDRLMP